MASDIERYREVIASQNKLIQAYKFQLYGISENKHTQIPVRILIHHKKLYDDYINNLVNTIFQFLNNCKSIVDNRIKKLSISVSTKALNKFREDCLHKLNYNNEKIFFKNVYLSETSEFDVMKRLKRKYFNDLKPDYLEKRLKYIFDKEKTLNLYELSKEELILSCFNKGSTATAGAVSKSEIKMANAIKKNPYKNVESSRKKNLGYDPNDSSRRKFDPNNPDLVFGEVDPDAVDRNKEAKHEKKEKIRKEKERIREKEEKRKREKEDRNKKEEIEKSQMSIDDSSDEEEIQPKKAKIRSEKSDHNKSVSFSQDTKENDALVSKKLAKKKKKEKRDKANASFMEDKSLEKEIQKVEKKAKEHKKEKKVVPKVAVSSDSEDEAPKKSESKPETPKMDDSDEEPPKKVVKKEEPKPAKKDSSDSEDEPPKKSVKKEKPKPAKKESSDSEDEPPKKPVKKEKPKLAKKESSDSEDEPPKKVAKKEITKKPPPPKPATKHKPVISSSLLSDDSDDTSSLDSDGGAQVKSTPKKLVKKPEVVKKSSKIRTVPKKADKPKLLSPAPKLARTTFTCYSCFDSNKISKVEGPFQHPKFKQPITICKECDKFLALGGWTFSEEDGKCDYCLISGEGGDIMSCDVKKCTNSFTTACLRQWYGDDYIDTLDADESIEFKCMICDTKKGYYNQYIKESKVCFEVLEQIKARNSKKSPVIGRSSKPDKAKSKIISSSSDSDSDSEPSALQPKKKAEEPKVSVHSPPDNDSSEDEKSQDKKKIQKSSSLVNQASKNLDVSDEEGGFF